MKQSRLLSRYGAFLDPFLVFGIFILFVIPVITVLNLTPSYRKEIQPADVLGSTSSEELVIEPNIVYQEGISVRDFRQTTPTSYAFEVQMKAHTKGEFQNLLFTAKNDTDTEKRINIASNFESTAPGTKISIIVDTVKFVILDTDSTIYPPTLYVLPGDTIRAYVKVESESNVNYDGGFGVELTIE